MRNLLSLFVILSFFHTGNSQIDLTALEYRCVGPSRGGRVTAVAGVASKAGTFYMGSTGGGVWKTTDFGTSWKNISDGYFESPSIGDIQVAQQNPSVLYVGTGSDGLRSNVIEGKGMYKSTDEGKSWKPVGLKNTGHIGAVEIHPEDENIVFVAAIGNAFKPNAERGVYRTLNGGEDWEKVLFLSDTIGFADLEFMPGNPNTLYAAAWRAERKPWTIISGGMEGGIYKSTDGGTTWNKLYNGLPTGLIGKIDLAVTPANPDRVYAIIEAPDGKGGLYRSEDQGSNFVQISDNEHLVNRPFYYTNVEADPKDPDVVYSLANRFLKSIDGGKTWTRLHPPHGDNHDMWIHPDNPQHYIQCNDGGANVTHNGGKTWSTQLNQLTAELYQVEVDDQNPYWLYAGQQDNYTTISVPSLPPNAHQAGSVGFMMNTGGCETGPAVPKPGNPDIVYANCKGRFSVYNKRTGQEKSYDVGAAYMYGHNPKELKFRFQRVSPIHVSPHDPNIVYHTSQFVHKTTDEGKTWEIISPDLTAFEADKQQISGSPITRDITGEEFYSTIYYIRESPLQAGLIWVGANDGPIHVTRDGGKTWTDVSPPIPTGGRVDSVEPSPFDPGTAYAAVLRYQLGDPKPYLLKTTDFGKSWTILTKGIPEDFPVRVVRADPNQKGLLYAGTEFGLFISFDDGGNWKKFQQNLPITPITDIKVHQNDLVLSTMGRSFWVLDNISTLHQGIANLDQKQHRLFAPKDTYRFRYRVPSSDHEQVQYPQSSVIIDYFLADKAERLEVNIYNEKGKLVRALTNKRIRVDTLEETSTTGLDMATNLPLPSLNKALKNKKGLQRFRWDMRHAGSWNKDKKRSYSNGPMVSPGKYTIQLKVDGAVYEQQFSLLADPRILAEGVRQEDLKAQEEISLQITNLLSLARQLAYYVQNQKKQLEKKENLSTSEQDRLQQLKATEAALIKKEGAYPKPMFIDQINYLLGITKRADQIPGKDVYDRFEELNKQYTKLKASVL